MQNRINIISVDCYSLKSCFFPSSKTVVLLLQLSGDMVEYHKDACTGLVSGAAEIK